MNIKNLLQINIGLIAFCLLLIPMSSQAILIQQGDSFRFEIDLTGAVPSAPYQFIEWGIELNDASGANGLDAGEILTVALFDDADTTNALGTMKYDYSNGSDTIYGFAAMMESDPQFDGIGYIDFTMETGSIDLVGGSVQGTGGVFPNLTFTRNGVTSMEVLPSTSVPEPATLALMGLALVILLLLNTSKNRNESSGFLPSAA